MKILIAGLTPTTVFPSQLKATKGSNVRFMCNSKRVIKWELGSKRLPGNTRIRGNFNHVLEITKVRRSNEGAYTCHYADYNDLHYYKSAALLIVTPGKVHYNNDDTSN